MLNHPARTCGIDACYHACAILFYVFCAGMMALGFAQWVVAAHDSGGCTGGVTEAIWLWVMGGVDVAWWLLAAWTSRDHRAVLAWYFYCPFQLVWSVVAALMMPSLPEATTTLHVAVTCSHYPIVLNSWIINIVASICTFVTGVHVLLLSS